MREDQMHTVSLHGLDIDYAVDGAGRDILYLPGGSWLAQEQAFIARLSTLGRVVTPELPGFGARAAPGHFNTADDLAYVCLDLAAALALEDVLVIGANFGGWVAAEMATKTCADIAALVLIDALGVRTGDREAREIVDLFALPDSELKRLAWADPSRFDDDPRSQSDAELARRVRAREALARYGWQPYMHNPKLPGRLHRITAPALFVWGACDRIVTPDYGRTYAAFVRGARFALVEDAGHFPHVEQPSATLDAIASFAPKA